MAEKKPQTDPEAPATEDEIRAAALRYVRKVSGTTQPSKANEALFAEAVDRIAEVTALLVHGMSTTAAPRDRAVEAERGRERNRKRFGGA